LRALGNPPKIERLTAEVLDTLKKEVGGVLTHELEGVYLDSAREFLATNPGLGVDWDLINRGAANWSRGAWVTGQPPDKWAYPAGLAELFTDPKDLDDVVKMFKKREVYRHLSNAADRGDEAANIITDIVVKMM